MSPLMPRCAARFRIGGSIIIKPAIVVRAAGTVIARLTLLCTNRAFYLPTSQRGLALS